MCNNSIMEQGTSYIGLRLHGDCKKIFPVCSQGRILRINDELPNCDRCNRLYQVMVTTHSMRRVLRDAA